MNQEIKNRIAEVNAGRVPEGYKRIGIHCIPQDWNIAKLRDKFDRITHRNTVGNENVLTISAHHGLISQGEFFNKDIASEKKDNYYLLNKGEFAYNKSYSGGHPFGAIKSLERYDQGIVSPLYIPFGAKDETNSNYYKQYFNACMFNHEIFRIAQEGARNHGLLNMAIEDFFNIKLIDPPNIEQQKIAEILAKWDEAIELQIKQIKTQQSKREILIEQLLKHKDNWEIKRLKSLCKKMQSGGTPKADNESYYCGDIPFVKIDDITLAGKYLTETKTHITEQGLKISSAWIVPKNSLLYTMYASIGFPAINLRDVATSQAIMCIVPDTNLVELEFLYYCLKNYRKKVIKFIETGTQGNLNAEIIGNIKISLPKVEEQKQIAKVLSCVDKQITFEVTKLEQLKLQKQTLMQLLLTGIVRVKL